MPFEIGIPMKTNLPFCDPSMDYLGILFNIVNFINWHSTHLTFHISDTSDFILLLIHFQNRNWSKHEIFDEYQSIIFKYVRIQVNWKDFQSAFELNTVLNSGSFKFWFITMNVHHVECLSKK